jgi:DHA3 family macrolide efflux protein-like MFS transporter
MSALQPTSSTSRGWRLINTRDFGLLWWGQTTSQIGEGLNKVALLWFVYELTGSAMKMTMVGLLQTIPPLVFGPLIGVYLDRLPKKAVMVWVDLVRALLTVLIPVLYALDTLSIEGLYGLVFLTSVVSTVFGPALVSAVPLLVRPSELMSANALIQGTNNIGMLLGPAISGIMIALIDAENVLFVNSATFLISAFCLMPIRFAVSHRRTVEGASSVWEELRGGFRFVFAQRSMVFTLVIISSLYNLGGECLRLYFAGVRQRVSSGWPRSIGLVVVCLGRGHVGRVHLAGLEETERHAGATAYRRPWHDHRRAGGV